MQRHSGFRDPLALDSDDDMSTSGASRPLPRVLMSSQEPLRTTGESSHTPPLPPSLSTRYTGTFGIPRPEQARHEPCVSASASGTASSSSRRSLGLSLGQPRNRTAAPKRDHSAASSIANTNTTEAARAVNQFDDAVRNTDSDALLCRLSALKLGYLPPEPFTQEFSTKLHTSGEQGPSRLGPGAGTLSRPSQAGGVVSKSPLINIGTYLRCTTIDSEVENFLKQGDEVKQIISVGAGSDSRHWRITSDPTLADQLHHYVEIDFVENAFRKLTRILRSTTLRSFFEPESTVYGMSLAEFLSSTDSLSTQAEPDSKRIDVLRSTKYTLLAADVRQLHPNTPAKDRIDPAQLFGESQTGLRKDLPTLILFECVLAYIAPEEADWLIRVLGETFGDIKAISYDIALAGDVDDPSPLSPQRAAGIDVENIDAEAKLKTVVQQQTSRFGQVMLQNLEMRKLSLPGAKAYPTIQAQIQRFAQAWSSTKNQVETEGRSLSSIWSVLANEHKSRLSRLEGLDEVEELDMLLKHYCVVQARRRS
ncbi:related to PPM1 |uniref:Leucine carboxyl methyltransferase 1 n=1 Tax=Melanopsichium pennsylvanicum TaxID=63383 RepID=A0AAJ4XQ17_9BASI|nr:related to PPM1 \